MTKILVIEDETAIRENIVELLEAEDFESFGAENGKIGIQMAKEKQPDLVLCDVMMPEIDGYGVLSAVRDEPDLATVPFIFLTAKSDRSDLRQGMDLGADDYLAKPCSPQELLQAIRTRLKKQATVTQKSQQNLDELRENITYALPHELRTPLNGILGFSDLLLSQIDSLDTEEIREIAEQINISGNRLYRLIQNFLIYADLELLARDRDRMEAARNCQIYDTKTLISDTIGQRARKARREADTTLDLVPGSVTVAGGRLKKLVEELVDNAYKFSEPGTPVVIRSTLDDSKYLLSVSDRGRGMSSDDIQKIGAYMQFERKLHEQQGSGLGLAIVKRMAQIHGGQLTIDSTPGEGTTMLVSLPTER
jgi:signal transduction histidine kinase